MPSNIALAARAQLENAAFQAAIVRMEEGYVDIIRNSEPHESNKREDAYRKLKLLGDFVDELKGMASDDAHERGRAEAHQMMK
jgi:hypothetical protein